MKREVFKSNLFRGVPSGIVSGYACGCLILVIALAFGMDENLFIPLLGVAIILSSIIAIIGGIGKSIEADANGIYLKNKEYLFAENDMYMNVDTHYYYFVPVTKRWIEIISKDGKHEVKCSFLGGRDAGRLAKIIEDGMRKKYRSVYGGVELNDVAVHSFAIPATELAEKFNKRTGLMIKCMFGFLTVLFSWILISMIVQDQLEDYGLVLVVSMIMVVLILGGTTLFICGRFKKSVKKIPYEILFCGGTMYIDGRSFGGVNIGRVLMTPERGDGRGDMRRLVIYEGNEKAGEYCFGFRGDQSGFPEYSRLIETVKENFGDKFAYDFN